MDLHADEFEAERQNLLDRVDTCAAQKAEQHKLEWESKKRAEEVKELQKVMFAAESSIITHTRCPQNFSDLRQRLPCPSCFRAAELTHNT